MASFRLLQFLTRTIHSFYAPPNATRLLPHRSSLQTSSQNVLSELPQLSSASSILNDVLWFAVPKKKISRHKKRLKTTVQKRISLNKNIIIDPRTGEVTLQHKMPANWRDYLPEV